MNSIKSDTSVKLLNLPAREPVKLRITDDDSPLTVIKARKPVIDSAPSHYTTVCDRAGRVISTDRPEARAVADGNAPRDDTDLDPNISAALDVIAGADAVCECDDDEPCRGKGPLRDVLPAYQRDRDSLESFTEAIASKPRETPHGDDQLARDAWKARERRNARERALERLQDELELVAEVREQTREELTAEVERRCLDGFREVKAEWKRKAMRRLLGACVCMFVAGLAIGAGIAVVVGG